MFQFSDEVIHYLVHQLILHDLLRGEGKDQYKRRWRLGRYTIGAPMYEVMFWTGFEYIELHNVRRAQEAVYFWPALRREQQGFVDMGPIKLHYY